MPRSIAVVIVAAFASALVLFVWYLITGDARLQTAALCVALLACSAVLTCTVFSALSSGEVAGKLGVPFSRDDSPVCYWSIVLGHCIVAIFSVVLVVMVLNG